MVGVQSTSIPFAPTLLCAGLGGSVAEIMTIPFDTMKVRLQLSQKGGTGIKYNGLLDCGKSMIRDEGVKSLYKGLTPGIQRQLAFCSLRVALFENFTEMISGDGKHAPKKFDFKEIKIKQILDIKVLQLLIVLYLQKKELKAFGLDGDQML